MRVESLERRSLLASGIDVAFYDFNEHRPDQGVIDLGSSDHDPITTAGDIRSPLYLGSTGNGVPPRGLALGSAFNSVAEPTPQGGQDDYIEFTVTPHGNRRQLSYSKLSFVARRNDPDSKDSLSVYYDNIPDEQGDNFNSVLFRTTFDSEDVYETFEIDLENVGGLTNQQHPITFRIYTWGTRGLGTMRLDNIRVQGRDLLPNPSELVFEGDSGRLIHRLDNQGDRIPDFSTAGYRNSEEPLPDVAAIIPSDRIVSVSPVAGDNTNHVQSAIDQVADFPIDANGFRGVVELSAGEFPINGQLQILDSGIVLRGAGDGDNPGRDTILRATGTSRRTLITVGQDTGFPSRIPNTTKSVVDSYVPVGASSFNVNSTAGLTVGLPVVVYRPSTQEWITALGMDNIANEPPENQWMPGNFNQYYERRITRIEGNRVFIDAPIMHALESQYGGGQIYQYTYPRISQVGIENIRGVSDFVGTTDENHARSFIDLAAVEDAWVRGVTGKHFVYATVHARSHSIRVTVDDARSLEPISQITGGRRYPFTIDGQFVLMKNLYSEGGRHDFVNNSPSRNRGPNVFLNGWAVDSNSSSGPHQKYSTGTLYDTISTDNQTEARNRGNFGTAHGWGGANMVFWNTSADAGNIIQSPPTSQNWIIGGLGRNINERRLGQQPPPIVDSAGRSIHFADPDNPTDSLFVGQHNDRLASFRDSPITQLREYVAGDYDLGNVVSAVDAASTDPDWRAALQAAVPDATISTMDSVGSNQTIPVTMDFQLGSNESVYAAILTLGIRTSDATADDDVVYVDSTAAPRTLRSIGNDPFAADRTTAVTMDLTAADLLSLQDGRLNLAIHGDAVLDWASLRLQVAENSPPLLTVDEIVVSGGLNQTIVNGGTFADPESQSVTLAASVGNVLAQNDGTWQWSIGATSRMVDAPVVITATDELGRRSTTTFTFNATSRIANRGIAYGYSPVYSDFDIPAGITALLPGQTATDANYSNYDRGLNRVVVDIAGLPNPDLDASEDFEFRIGNDASPSQWSVLDDRSTVYLPNIEVVPDVGTDVDRVILSWLDDSIANQWLQVTIKANETTGLRHDDVFYFGHQYGDTYGVADTDDQGHVRVNATDELFVRLNQSSGAVADLENRYDLNRDAVVDHADAELVRLAATRKGLKMFSAPPTSELDLATQSRPQTNVDGLSFTTFKPVDSLSPNLLNYFDRLLQRVRFFIERSGDSDRVIDAWIRRFERTGQRLERSAIRLQQRSRLAIAERRLEVAVVMKSMAAHLEADRLDSISSGEDAVANFQAQAITVNVDELRRRRRR